MRISYQRVIGVRVAKERADRKENFRNCQSWGPLRPENVEANTPVAVYVWVVDLCRERDLSGPKSGKNTRLKFSWGIRIMPKNAFLKLVY